MPHDPGLNQSKLDHYISSLTEKGFCIIPDAMPREAVQQLDADLDEGFRTTPFCQGGFYGERTKRFGRLLSRSPVAKAFVQHDLVLGIVEQVLGRWCDTLQLNLTQAVAIHPGALPQLPHRDQDMWRGAIGEIEYLVNVMWPLTDYTADNGATLLWPASHGAAALETAPSGDPILAEMRAGDALLFLGSTLHGAGANRSPAARRGLIVSYCLGWLKPYENQWLAYPPEVARTFSRELAALVGYCQHRPNLGNYEGQCPSVLFAENADRHLGAIDALRPDQETEVAAFVVRQRQNA